MVGDEPTAAPVVTPVAPAGDHRRDRQPELLEGTAPVVDAAPAQPPAAQVAAVQQPAAVRRRQVPLAGQRQGHHRLRRRSKGTGINIEAPEGAAVRAAENGTVIYVGSGVEGYGNLVLIRHANGYVSAYAHLKDIERRTRAPTSPAATTSARPA